MWGCFHADKTDIVLKAATGGELLDFGEDVVEQVGGGLLEALANRSQGEGMMASVLMLATGITAMTPSSTVNGVTLASRVSGCR